MAKLVGLPKRAKKLDKKKVAGEASAPAQANRNRPSHDDRAEDSGRGPGRALLSHAFLRYFRAAEAHGVNSIQIRTLL